MNHAVAVATCGSGEGDPIYSAFDQLGADLLGQGVRLVLFTFKGVASRAGFDAIQVPLLVSSVKGSDLPKIEDPTLLKNIQLLDSTWGHCTVEAAAVSSGIAAWERVFDLLRPSIVLSWHTTPPVGYLHRALAERKRLAWWAIERGPFPETLDMSRGQSSFCALATEPSMFRSERGDRDLRARFDEIRSYYEEAGTQRPWQKPVDEQRRAELMDGDGPRVLYLGCADVPSGCSLSPPHAAAGLAERASPAWATSERAAADTVSALGQTFSHATLWLRPHPHQPFDLQAQDSCTRIVKASRDDVIWLIKHADIIVGLLSTTMIFALLWGKPQISLANSQAFGRDIFLEARSVADISQALVRAASRDYRPVPAAQEAVALLFDRQLIGLTPTTPTKLGLGDAAKLLARFRGADVPGEGEWGPRLAAAAAVFSTAAA